MASTLMKLVLAFMLLAISPLPAIAEAANKLLMFEQDACPWCEAWRREVGVIYDKTPEGKQAPLVMINIDDPIPEQYSLDYGVVYTPTFVLLEDGVEIGRIEGYPGEGFFWARLEKLLL